MLKKVIVASFITLLPCSSNAQWEAIGDFPYQIVSVYFMDQVGRPEIGFVSTLAVGSDSTSLWRTSDGGLNWHGVRLPFEGFPLNYGVEDFTFEDGHTGWLADYNFIRKTTDAGLFWTPLGPANGGGESNVAIYFDTDSKRLLSSFWQLSNIDSNVRASSDSGLTWTMFGRLHGGFAFSGLNGVVTAVNQYPPSVALYTTDGGVTWAESGFSDECWQPACFPGTSTFFAASESMNRVSRSDDGGKTWRIINALAPPFTNDSTVVLSGCIRADKCGNLYVQTHYKGILMSADTGVSWHSIGGPSAFTDVRFWISDDYIYAGDGLNNLPGGNNPSKVWRYRLSSPPAPQVTVSASSALKVAGDTVTVFYTMQRDSLLGFNTVHFALHFDDAFDLRNVMLPPGWRVLDSSSASGTLDLWIISDQQPLRSQLLALSFGTALENSFAKIYLDSIHFYPSHPAICGDNVAAIAGPDSVEIDFDLTNCNDPILLRTMSGQSPFEIVSVVPNPAQSEVAVAFAGEAGSSIEYRLYDMIGTERARGTFNTPPPFQGGGGGWSIDVAPLPSGIYYLRCSSNGYVQTRSITVAR
ncbi:MAG: hypothetical protein Q8922_11480 [Bacteroidota bacterium]|nr:hypothetical protein [Bacteroidota bacterium]MDP4233619.1 hypothetical protein [Bacteroidota bacterium]MDP4288547.1 hypothetical protein [Bacteroidota bacterium]